VSAVMCPCCTLT